MEFIRKASTRIKNIFRKKNKRNLSFTLTDREQELAEQIYKEKGSISYKFTPTGIGTELIITVLKTGEEFNITDYSVW